MCTTYYEHLYEHLTEHLKSRQAEELARHGWGAVNETLRKGVLV